MMAWLCAVSLLGVFMAIPLKRQLINEEGLPFPSEIATAETLKSMHSSGAEALAAFATKHGLTDEATVWQRQFERLAK